MTVTAFIRRNWIVAAVLALTACASAPPATRFPQLTYSHLGTFTLDVSEIEIVDAYQPPLQAPNVDHLMPVSPAAAARQWARDRLRQTGSSGRRAVFTIDDGAVTETTLQRQSGIRGVLTVDQSERYDARIGVRLDIVDISGRRVASAEADARRSRTVPEDITLVEREKVWFALTEALTNDLNAEMERAITQFLGDYLR